MLSVVGPTYLYQRDSTCLVIAVHYNQVNKYLQLQRLRTGLALHNVFHTPVVANV